jgi:ATP-dependent helicase/nuclease subunit B
MFKNIDLFNKKGFLPAVSKKIKEIYSENIFDFLFLTDDMNLLKTITEEIIENSKESIYTKNFKTISKYTVEIYKQRKEKEILPNDFFEIFFEKIEKNSSNLIQIFKIYRELEFFKEHISKDSKYSLYQKEFSENIYLSEKMEKLENKYNTFLKNNPEYTDMSLVFKYILENIEIENKNIVIFTAQDSPFINALIEKIKDKNTIHIINTNKQIPEKLGEIVKTKNDLLEIQSVVSDIKDKIINQNLSPEDFQIIAQNENQVFEIMDLLEKIKVPYKTNYKFNLKNSQIVKTILYFYEYIFEIRPKDISKMIDFFYIKNSRLNTTEFENLFNRFRLYNQEQKNWPEIIKAEKENQLQDYEDENAEKIDQIEEFERLINYFLEDIQSIQQAIQEQKLSESLDIVLKKYFDTEKYKEELIIEKEQMINFKNIIRKTEEVQELLKKETNSKKIFKIVSQTIENKNYQLKNINSNCVEITDLYNSQYTIKKIKYFLDFTMQNYPILTLNPTIKSTSKQLSKHYQNEEKEQRTMLLNASTTSQKNYYMFPNTNLKGEENTLSTYASEIAETQNNAIYTKQNYIETNPEYIFDETEYDLLNTETKEEFKKQKENIENPLEGFKNLEYETPNKISFSRLDSYKKCEFYYYLKYILKIYPEIDRTKFFEGSLKHVILEELFKKYPQKSQIAGMLEETLREKISELFEKHYPKMAFEDLKYQTRKDIYKENIVEDLTTFVFEMTKEYEEVIDTEREIIREVKGYQAQAFIDRIDKTEKGELRLIDYKNSNSSYKLEQLLFYYNILLKDPEWNQKINQNTTILKFQPLKKDKGKIPKDYHTIINKNVLSIMKQRGGYVDIENTEYFDWFDQLMDKFDKKENKPLMITEKAKYQNFIDKLKDKKLKVKNDNNNKEECKGYLFNCDYYDLCTNMQYLKKQESSDEIE